MIDTKNLTKKGQISRESLYKFIEPPLNTSSFCKKSCNYKCIHESTEQVIHICKCTPYLEKRGHDPLQTENFLRQMPFWRKI